MIDLTVPASGGAWPSPVFSVPEPRQHLTTAPAIRLVPLADLDVATEAGARAELARACDGPGGYRSVVVDSVPGWFVDVRGLAVLLDSAALARRHGRDLVVVRPPESLRRAVNALDLGDQLHFVNHLDDLD